MKSVILQKSFGAHMSEESNANPIVGLEGKVDVSAYCGDSKRIPI